MKLKYNISRKQLLWHHRRTIAAALAVLAAARIGYGYLTEGPPPELTLLRKALVHATPDLSKLPRYDIFASDKNVMLLENSGSERMLREYANVELVYTDPATATKKRARGEMRQRGFHPSLGAKHLWKLVLEDESIVGLPVVHLLSDEVKYSHWYVLHMWLAEQLGLKTPRTRFVRVRFNTVDLGLFVEMEHWSRGMLARYGLGPSDLYGEDDDAWNPVNLQLYDNVAKWKKYDSRPGADSDFVHLDRLLNFLNDSDDETFRRHIFSFIDRDSVAAWHMHMSLMDSYHQTSVFNIRLLHNRATGLFELLPWDALPEIYSTQDMAPHELYMLNRLVVRLRNHPEYLELYSRRLYQFIEEHEERLVPAYMDMYANNDVAMAVYKDQRRLEPVLLRQFRWPTIDQSLRANLGSLKDDVFSWDVVCKERIRRIRQTWRYLKRTLELTRLSFMIELDPPETSTVHNGRVRINYAAQVPARIDQLRIPLRDWQPLAGATLPVSVELIPVPQTGIVHRPLFPKDRLPPRQLRELQATVTNGYLVIDRPDLTLVPGFPKLELTWRETEYNGGQHRDPLHFASAEAQQYTLAVTFPQGVQADLAGFQAAARNLATLDPIVCEYKHVGMTGFAEVLQRRADPAQLPAAFPWMVHDPSDGSLRVTPGTIEVSGRVVIPAGTRLVVRAGTRFRMGPHASLISFSPLLLEGAPQNPIVFERSDPDQPWGVLAVVDSPQPSILRCTELHGGGTDEYLGIQFLGALSAHRAAIQQDHVQITGSQLAGAVVIRESQRSLTYE